MNQAPYIKLWNWFKNYPEIFSKGSDLPPETSGTAAAALLSAGLGCVMLGVAHHIATVNTDLAQAIADLGRWIPGSTGGGDWGGLGIYAGEQTILYLCWLSSWGLLHSILHPYRVTYKAMFWGLFILFGLATLMCWTPIFPYLHLR